MKPLARMLGLTLATLLIAGPAISADEDLGELTTKKPARKQTVEEENNDPSRSGPMIGVGAAYAMENFGSIGISPDDSAAYNLHVGYRFNRWISEDLEVERYQEFDAPTGEVNGWAIGLNTKIYALAGRFQPFGIIGINLLDMETSDSAATNPKKTDDGPAMRLGGGLDIYATTKVVVSADITYMLGFGEVDDYDLISFSLGFFYRP